MMIQRLVVLRMTERVAEINGRADEFGAVVLTGEGDSRPTAVG